MAFVSFSLIIVSASEKLSAIYDKIKKNYFRVTIKAINYMTFIERLRSQLRSQPLPYCYNEIKSSFKYYPILFNALFVLEDSRIVRVSQRQRLLTSHLIAIHSAATVRLRRTKPEFNFKCVDYSKS